MAQGERLDGVAPSGTAAAPGPERRGSLRVPADGVSVLVETAEGQRPARVCDVSRSGLRIALDAAAPPPLGGRVRLLHGQAGELVGTCVRHGHGEVGIALEAASSEIERALQCLALLLAEQERTAADPAASA